MKLLNDNQSAVS